MSIYLKNKFKSVILYIGICDTQQDCAFEIII